uniref:Uncharacterized protein n=1 Tax=Vespula pensylvanica TaxID=30213 RepID=A0A834PCP5_VESPE|nr:hypothetical protein H0235_003883 [Vespula pensylvanica]
MNIDRHPTRNGPPPPPPPPPSPPLPSPSLSPPLPLPPTPLAAVLSSSRQSTNARLLTTGVDEEIALFLALNRVTGYVLEGLFNGDGKEEKEMDR